MDCLIVGGGNIGKLFAACLGAPEAPVVVREVGPHAEAMQRTGIVLKVGEREIRPAVRVVRDFSEIDRSRSWLVVFCVKAYDLEASLRELSASGVPVAGTVTPLNGLGIEERVSEHFPGAEIVASSVTFPVESEGPGVARVTNPRGGIAFARHSGPRSGVVERVVQAVSSRGLEATTCPSAASMRWSKLLLNIVSNATSAILDMRAGEVYGNLHASMVERLMIREFFATARAAGVDLVELPEYPLWRLRLIGLLSSPPVPLFLFRRLFGARVGRARGDKRASFDLDVNVLGRTRTEVAWYNGGIAEAARRVGRSAPCNERLAAILERVAADETLRQGYRRNPERLYREITEGP